MEYNLMAEQYHITNDIGFMKESTRHFIINLSAYSIRPINNGPTKTHKLNRGWQKLLSLDTKHQQWLEPIQNINYKCKRKTQSRRVESERGMEEVWNEIKGFLQSQKKGRNSLFQVHHLSLSLSTHATQAYGLIQTHICDQRQSNHTYSGAKRLRYNFFTQATYSNPI